VLVGLLTALLIAPPELDEAAPTRYRLSWEAPDRCPTVEQVRGRIDELLAYAPADAGEPIVAEVRVIGGESGFVASLRMQTGASEGRRELGDVDCRELGEAVALIVALAVDPELMSREPEQQPVELEPPIEDPEPPIEDPEPPIEDPSDPEEPIEQPDPPAASARLRGFGLGLRGGAGFGVLGLASGRVTLAAAAFGRLWRAELGGSLWIPQAIDIGRFSIVAAELRGCWVPELRAVEFPICAGVEAGAMTGVGRVSGGRRATAPWLAATPGLGVSWVGLQDRLAIGLRVDATLPIVRPAFASDEGRLLIRTGFGAQLLAGVEVRFSADRRR